MKHLLSIFLFSVLLVNAQPPSVPPAKPTVFNGTGAPSAVANAQFGDQYVDLLTGNVYTCVNTQGGCSGQINAWTQGGGSGSGSVTSVATGDGLTGGTITSTGTISATTALINDSIGYCSDAGASDSYACNLSPAPLAYVTGARYRFRANTSNTGAASISFNSLGAVSIKKAAGGVTTSLADNDIRSGQVVDLVYDGTNMQMQSLLGNAPVAGSGDPGSLVPVTFSSTPVFTCNSNTSSTFSLTLTGAVASSTFASCATGQRISLIVCQDATGSRTFVGPTNLKNFPSVSATSHYCTAASGTYDGANLVVGVANVFKDDYSAIGSQLPLNGSTSGTTTLQPSATASGTITLPAATDTLMGKATTDTMTNKSFDTAGTGNSLKVNGTAITAVSGSGAICLASGSACGGGSGGATFTSGFTGAGAPNISASASSFIAIHDTSFLQNTERNVQLVVHKAGTAQHLCVQTVGTQDASGALVFTLRVNGSNTSVVATVTAAATQNEFCSSGTASVSSGDALDIAVANAATATSAFWISTYLEID